MAVAAVVVFAVLAEDRVGMEAWSVGVGRSKCIAELRRRSRVRKSS